MRKLLTGGIIFLGVVSLPVATSPRPVKSAPDYKDDPRLHLLRKFFRQAECPAERFAHSFLQAADTYHLDWRLLPSISFVESTGGKAARNNNMFGWDSGRARFDSMEAGIHAVGYYLSHLGVYRGKTLDNLLATYNPNAKYAHTVKLVMRSIAPN